jgi:hypothetical protein
MCPLGTPVALIGMFASIRCYVLKGAAIGEVAGPVDEEFADLLAGQPGFVWYALLDCGEGQLMTISLFHEREQASGSRALSRQWTSRRLGKLDLTLTEALNGAIPVSRAAPALLQAAPGRFTRVRSYRLGEGELGEVVWRIVDTRLAERMAELDGFVAYFVFSSGAGELVTVSVFRERAAATASDDVALTFVRDELADVEIERSDSIGGGEIVVSRVTDALLEPIHA